MTPGIADFLLARIAEDETVARKDSADAMVGWRWKHYPREAYEEIQAVTLSHSVRVLAECEAKRRIVESARHTLFDDPLRRTEFWRGARDVTEADLRFLALPYADHAGYDPAWRP